MLDTMREGGAVLWVIVASGFVAFVVFIERSLHLHRARIKSEDFLKGILTILRRNNVREALAVCEETPGPVSCLIRTAIVHRERGKEEVREAMEDAGRAEVSRMERRLVVLATVAQISPLLGLLGTVLGMVRFLLGLQASVPLIQSADVLSGLLRAMLCTAAGLTVAIPCHVAFNYLVVKIDRLVLDMEKAASEILAFMAGGFKTESNGHHASERV